MFYTVQKFAISAGEMSQYIKSSCTRDLSSDSKDQSASKEWQHISASPQLEVNTGRSWGLTGQLF